MSLPSVSSLQPPPSVLLPGEAKVVSAPMSGSSASALTLAGSAQKQIVRAPSAGMEIAVPVAQRPLASVRQRSL
jgi:hypothetical protein